MKNTYVVKVYVDNREELVDMFDKLATVNGVTYEVSVKRSEPVVRAPRKAPESERAQSSGGGKLSVNEAILQALDQGPASVGALKEALLSAGKSAASLSTGIAALTKSGKIERSGDGEYAKAA